MVSLLFMIWFYALDWDHTFYTLLLHNLINSINACFVLFCFCSFFKQILVWMEQCFGPFVR